MSLTRVGRIVLETRICRYSTIQFKRHCNSTTTLDFSFHVEQQFPEITTNQKQRQYASFDKTNHRKQIINESKPQISDYNKLRSFEGATDIKQSLLKSDSSEEVLSIIQNNRNLIARPQIYSIAFKQCIKFKDCSQVPQIMDFLLNDSNVKPTKFEFTQFFNAMALSNISPKISDEYFQRMVNELKIIPDKYIFTILIKGCKKESMYKLAESYWISMQSDYKIIPSSWSYTEMISVYATANKTTKAVTLFNQYYDKLKIKEVQSDLTTFNAYLNVFARNGDTKGMAEALKIIQQRHISLNKMFITEIMSGYIKAKKPKNAIKIFNSWMQQNNTKGNIKGIESILELKCIALSHIMKDDKDIKSNLDKKSEIYREIESIINQLLLQKDEGDKKRFSLYHAKILLQAAIIMYHDNDTMEIVKVFEYLMKNAFIPYKQEQNVIDLRVFELIQTQFILRYIIGFKQHNHHLMLMVGTDNMKEFVIKELLTYNPPIQCKEDENHKGLLVVNKEDLIPYNENTINYVKWHWHDTK